MAKEVLRISNDNRQHKEPFWELLLCRGPAFREEKCKLLITRIIGLCYLVKVFCGSAIRGA